MCPIARLANRRLQPKWRGLRRFVPAWTRSMWGGHPPSHGRKHAGVSIGRPGVARALELDVRGRRTVFLDARGFFDAIGRVRGTRALRWLQPQNAGTSGEL